MTSDRLSASILVLFALLVILESRHLPLGTFRQPGPAYVPVLLASLLLIFGVLLMLTAAALRRCRRSIGRSGAMPWRFWWRASSLSLPSSVSVIVSPCSSCSPFSSKSWRNAAGRCRWYSPLPWLSVRTSFSTPSCECPCRKGRGDFEEPRMENGGLSTDDSTTLSYKPWSAESRLFFCLSGARRNLARF